MVDDLGEGVLQRAGGRPKVLQEFLLGGTVSVDNVGDNLDAEVRDAVQLACPTHAGGLHILDVSAVGRHLLQVGGGGVEAVACGAHAGLGRGGQRLEQARKMTTGPGE